MPSKSRMFRVAIAMPRECAIAAIWLSGCETGRAAGGGNLRISAGRSAVEGQNPICKARPQHSFETFGKTVSASPWRHHRKTETQLRLADCRQKQAPSHTACNPRCDRGIGHQPHQLRHYIRIQNEHGRRLN